MIKNNFYTNNNNNTVFFHHDNSVLLEEYYCILLLLVIAIILSVLILGLSYNLAIQNPDTEKLSAYECGFEPYEDARIKFDVKFYIVAILFVIFDIEAIFLFPWSVTLSRIDVLGFWSMVDFIFELGVGLFYVWVVGALDWE